MNVHYMIPYSVERNLGAAYNQAMSLIPDADSACFTDGDSMMLIPNWGHLIHQYSSTYHNAVLTCWLNRIHPLATGQQHQINSTNVSDCLEAALELSKKPISVTPIYGSVSGTLLLIPKYIWQLHPFCEVNTFRPNEPNLLGCDNEWTNRIRRHGVQVLRMNTILLYHQYRLISNSKAHLL